jgi:hypothetical protein
MRTFIIILCIVVALVVACGIYLAVTTPTDARPLHFPLTPSQQALLARVPANADAYALIASPAVLMRKLEANPVTREAVAKWTDEHALPPSSFLGRADAVLWRTGKATSYAVHFDPVRAFFVRLWTMSGHADAQWDGRTLIIDPAEGTPPASPPSELHPAIGLPDGDVFVVQREEARGAYPPIGRPAMSSVRVTATDIELTSRAVSQETEVRAMARPALPRTAMLAVAFTDPPRILGDMNRLLASDLDALVGDGGVLALYDVDTGTFLPRPFLAIAVPADDDGRAALANYERVIDTVGTKLEQNGELVISFDRNTAPRYVQDARAPLPWPANRWAVRIDPPRLIPVLRKVGDNPALRFATPRIHRGARDLRRWMGALEQARVVEAADSVAGGFEELRVRIASK